MKSVGIVRRIDNLGRIVIPKEIRQILRIRSGDALEITTDPQGGVLFKKYSPAGNLASFAQEYMDVLSKYSNAPLLICDPDRVVCAAGASSKEYLERRISPELEKCMKHRQSFISAGKSIFQPVEGVDRTAAIIFPIIASYDVLGSVVLLQNENGDVPSMIDITLVQVAAAFLGKQMED